MPRVSVLMPVYNTPEDYLREAIESILVQTFEDFELLIVNDGSTANIADIVLSYRDERIRYYANAENRGVVVTRNRLVALSTGEYLAMMDSDDISLPDRFAKQVAFLDQHPEIGVLGAWIEFFPKFRIVKRPSESKLIKQYLLFSGSSIMNPTVMVRRSLPLHYDEQYSHAEDYILWLNLIDKTEFCNIEEVLVKYRWHGGNLSQCGKQEQEQCAVFARREAQRQYFGRDDSCIQLLADQEGVRWNELHDLLPFLRLMGKHAGEHGRLYREIISKTKGGKVFISFLWQDKLNRLMKIRLRHKIIHTLRSLVQILK